LLYGILGLVIFTALVAVGVWQLWSSEQSKKKFVIDLFSYALMAILPAIAIILLVIYVI